jgi:hypothetical protein
MINGVHLLFYSRDPEADRAFFRNVLNFKSIDAGEGWLIFALPPAELSIHPGDGQFIQRHADQELSGTVLDVRRPAREHCFALSQRINNNHDC